MFCAVVFLFFLSCAVHVSQSFWMTDWMLPVQEEIKEINNLTRRSGDTKWFPEDRKVSLTADRPDRRMGYRVYNEQASDDLRAKLESTLIKGRTLANTLKQQIEVVASRETILKQAIVNGKSGVSTVVVSTSGAAIIPNQYIIREGFWSQCFGQIQAPMYSDTTNLFNDVFSAPKCIGNEISANPDPCVFNSVIKYETLPTRRTPEYSEDEFLCLRSEFNSSLQQYYSVPRSLINDTCNTGVVRSMTEQVKVCGPRVVAEYSYYPHRSAAHLPLEYCPDRACKLFVAWHIFNNTIENIETFKNEKNFKKFFITPKPDEIIERLL